MPLRGLQSRESAEIRSAVLKQIGRELRVLFQAELDERLASRLDTYMQLSDGREQGSDVPSKDRR